MYMIHVYTMLFYQDGGETCLTIYLILRVFAFHCDRIMSIKNGYMIRENNKRT